MELQKGIKKRKSIPSDWMLSLLLLFYIFWKTVPIFAYYCSTYIAMALLVCLFILLFLGSRIQANKVPILIVPVICYLLLLAAELLVIKNGDPFYALWDVFLCGLALLSGYLVIIRKNERVMTRLIWGMIIAYTITAATTYIGTLFFPQASRAMTAEPALFNLYYPYNIGGFGFIYSLVLLHPFFVFFLRKMNKTLPAVVVTVISGLCVVESEFATAALLFLVSCIVYFFPSQGSLQTVKRRIGFIVLFLIIVFVFLPAILNWISEWPILEGSAEKIADIANMLQGKETVGEDTELRRNMYLASWNSFLENPILGTSFFASEKGGGHSFFMDLLARWGLVGLAIVCALGGCLWKWYRTLSQRTVVGYVAVLSFAMVIILQILNPTFWSFELGFAIPLFLFVTADRERQEAE